MELYVKMSFISGNIRADFNRILTSNTASDDVTN